MCCIISGEPVEDTTGRLKTFGGPVKFQKSMLEAPFASCTSMLWCCGQFIPPTCGCTQCFLRKKVLDGDMTKYSCFQGYFNVCCCIKAGSCGEQNCPDCCLFLESCFCNFAAVSASRMYVMERYDLASDPYLRELSRLINLIADIFYHCVSGCMTAQVAFEKDYQNENNPNSDIPQAVPVDMRGKEVY